MKTLLSELNEANVSRIDAAQGVVLMFHYKKTFLLYDQPALRTIGWSVLK